ncbi:hypothetical protein RCG96_16765 [Kocuria sp. CPCC 205236]
MSDGEQSGNHRVGGDFGAGGKMTIRPPVVPVTALSIRPVIAKDPRTGSSSGISVEVLSTSAACGDG